jgi:deoxyribodipyrimidine photo-lyase
MKVFLFHRDLRLEDNTALIAAEKDVLPIFVFTPEQIDRQKNAYFSNNAVQFMCESLQELDQAIRKKHPKVRLYVFHGDTVEVLEALHKATTAGQQGGGISAVHYNEDYSKYARERDAKVAQWCRKHNIGCITAEDYGLLPLKDGLLLSDSEDHHQPYRVLSQFYKRVQKDYTIRKPNTARTAVYSPHAISRIGHEEIPGH